jgi:hypothetical protein
MSTSSRAVICDDDLGNVIDAGNPAGPAPETRAAVLAEEDFTMAGYMLAQLFDGEEPLIPSQELVVIG